MVKKKEEGLTFENGVVIGSTIAFVATVFLIVFIISADVADGTFNFDGGRFVRVDCL